MKAVLWVGVGVVVALTAGSLDAKPDRGRQVPRPFWSDLGAGPYSVEFPNRIHPRHAEHHVVACHERRRAERSLAGVTTHSIYESPDLDRRQVSRGCASIEQFRRSEIAQRLRVLDPECPWLVPGLT